MKKFIKEHRNIVIIIVSVLLVLLIIIAIILATKGHKNLKKMPNEYIIQEREVELPGTKVVSNDNLNSEQCLDGICVSNVVIHSTADQGRVECTITNKSEKKKKGYLKLVFNDKKLVVSYATLAVNDSTKAYAQFSGYSLQDVSDYSLEKVTKEEKKAFAK